MPPSRTAPTLRGKPGRVVGLDREPQSVAGPVGRLELAPGILRRKRPSGSSFPMPMTEFVVAGHADVGHEGGAARQDAVVGGRRMGMGADHEAGAAVGEIAHRLLLAGRLAMHVDDDGVGAAS